MLSWSSSLQKRPPIWDPTPVPILWLDTAGNEEAREDNAGCYSNQNDIKHQLASSSSPSTSKSNRYEATVVVKYLQYLCSAVETSCRDNEKDHYDDRHRAFAKCIGIITPYNAQVELLKRTLAEVKKKERQQYRNGQH